MNTGVVCVTIKMLRLQWKFAVALFLNCDLNPTARLISLSMMQAFGLFVRKWDTIIIDDPFDMVSASRNSDVLHTVNAVTNLLANKRMCIGQFRDVSHFSDMRQLISMSTGTAFCVNPASCASIVFVPRLSISQTIPISVCPWYICSDLQRMVESNTSKVQLLHGVWPRPTKFTRLVALFRDMLHLHLLRLEDSSAWFARMIIDSASDGTQSDTPVSIGPMCQYTQVTDELLANNNACPICSCVYSRVTTANILDVEAFNSFALKPLQDSDVLPVLLCDNMHMICSNCVIGMRKQQIHEVNKILCPLCRQPWKKTGAHEVMHVAAPSSALTTQTFADVFSNACTKPMCENWMPCIALPYGEAHLMQLLMCDITPNRNLILLVESAPHWLINGIKAQMGCGVPRVAVCHLQDHSVTCVCRHTNASGTLHIVDIETLHKSIAMLAAQPIQIHELVLLSVDDMEQHCNSLITMVRNQINAAVMCKQVNVIGLPSVLML